MTKVHFMGIGGSGTSAIASIAQANGFDISGCDKDINNEFTQAFSKDQLFEGHSPNHLRNINILAITPAILALNPNNEEIAEAKKRGIEVLTWQEFMGKYLEKDKFVIAVCGTHGKSTTTAMIGTVLEDANLDPTVELGTIVPKWNSNYRIGTSKYFISEADEFNDNYLPTHPNITVVTTIEMDHPEYFKDFDSYKDSFIKFLSQTKQAIVANISDPNVAEVIKVVMKQSSVTVVDYSKNDLGTHLKVLGNHNKLNAQAAFQVGILLGLEPMNIQHTLASFEGLSRRFEKLGYYKGAEIYSDFAHHPTEIKVTIDSVRKKYPTKRIVLIYQPHMFSRTKALFEDFVKVLKEIDADQIFLLDIYPSREVDTGIVHSKELVEAINKRTVSYLGSPSEAEQFLKMAIREGDIVIFMGAGDIDKLGRKITNG